MDKPNDKFTNNDTENSGISDYVKDLQKYIEEASKTKQPEHKETNKFVPKCDTIYLKMYPDYHLLTAEEQIYFIKITEGVFGYNEQVRNEMLKILSYDYNVTFLAHYLCTFIKDCVHLNIVFTDLTLLIYAVRMTKSLLANPHINLKEYLHELLPAILSCGLSKRISKYYYDNHWTLRDFSAYVVAMICHMYCTKLNNITQRVINIYLSAINDVSKPLTSIYGALKGLSSLGEDVTKNIIIPTVPFLSQRLYVVLERKTIFFEENKQQIIEAKRVRDVIVSILSPIFLKYHNTNDGGMSYIKEFGYIGRGLYIQVKNLEKIEFERKQLANFVATIPVNTVHLNSAIGGGMGQSNYLSNYIMQQEIDRNNI